MANTLNKVYSQLPSPPLSPVTQLNTQLPSPPLSPITLPLFSPLPCDEFRLENNEEFDFTEKEIKYLENFLGFEIERPKESSIEPSREQILRNRFMNMMEEGVEINGNLTPYDFAVERLHSIGEQLINRVTDDAVLLRVFERGNNSYEEFWVHPIFLCLQSFQLFKVFEENKLSSEQGVIEIEVPSLKAFIFNLYYIYTGDNTKLLEIATLNEPFFDEIMENFEYLEIDITSL